MLLIELAALPWTAHAYDAAAFLSHTDRVYFAHVWPTRMWPFGSILLATLLISQLPVLLFPRLWDAVALRLFLLKLPAWLADVGSAFVIRACSAQPQLANAWALRYLLDPIVIFVTVFHGQSDAIPNLCVVAGIAAMLAERYELAAFALGLGVGAKFYPAAFAPLLIVAALRRANVGRAVWSAAIFGATAVATLLPVFIGRSQSVAGSWINNSFGPEGNRVAIASLWALLPWQAGSPALPPQFEQAVAVAIPIALALFELRHIPGRADLARAAMLAALSAVLLNPGAHPPFYLWIAGPLVLYAAVSGNGAVSLAGITLSCLAVLTQFCQEPGGEYFKLTFGAVAEPGVLHCVAPSQVLQSLVLINALAIVIAAYRSQSISERVQGRLRVLAQYGTTVFLLVFATGVAVEAAGAMHVDPAAAFREEELRVNTLAVFPAVRYRSDGSCSLTYDANDMIVYAGNPYASRFGSAVLRYTLFSPTEMTIHGRTVALDSVASTFERSEVFTEGVQSFRIERQFDISALLRPFRYVEEFVERPCNLIRGNPVLIYRFDIPAARIAARSQERGPRSSIQSRYHV